MKKLLLLFILLIVSPLMGQEYNITTHDFFHKIGVSTRLEYTQINPIRIVRELWPVKFAKANTFRSVTILEIMLGKTEKIYFYAQGRFSSFLPYNTSFDYIGRGQLSGGILLGFGGKMLEGKNGVVYANWGLVYDSKIIDTFANYPYFDNEVNFQFTSTPSVQRIAFVYSIYIGFGVTEYNDGGDPDKIVTLRSGMGIGFLF